jgi:hypothetical protein
MSPDEITSADGGLSVLFALVTAYWGFRSLSRDARRRGVLKSLFGPPLTCVLDNGPPPLDCFGLIFRFSAF